MLDLLTALLGLVLRHITVAYSVVLYVTRLCSEAVFRPPASTDVHEKRNKRIAACCADLTRRSIHVESHKCFLI